MRPARDHDAPIPGEERLREIVGSTPWLMQALFVAAEVDAPQWLIGAGALRNAVWDRLHDFAEPTPLADIDLIFFDPADLSENRETEIEEALRAKLPDLPWEATNQAAVHLWYGEKFGIPVPPFRSAAEAVGTWPETATSVAVRLERGRTLTVVAPVGLEDLLGQVHRRNPQRVSVAEYQRRLAEKRIAEKWPQVRIEADPGADRGSEADSASRDGGDDQPAAYTVEELRRGLEMIAADLDAPTDRQAVAAVGRRPGMYRTAAPVEPGRRYFWRSPNGGLEPMDR